MKYEIVGIAHAVGDFTPPAGKNADTVRHYDVHLHRKGTIPYCGSIGFMLYFSLYNGGARGGKIRRGTLKKKGTF